MSKRLSRLQFTCAECQIVISEWNHLKLYRAKGQCFLDFSAGKEQKVTTPPEEMTNHLKTKSHEINL